MCLPRDDFIPVFSMKNSSLDELTHVNGTYIDACGGLASIPPWHIPLALLSQFKEAQKNHLCTFCR